ncbi:hypothetical protein SH83_15325 (plasmid) [Lactiplantibacillus plantarum]|nr:hypothetical protein SH83_15325 [Lactiplantibacillus plantarum]
MNTYKKALAFLDKLKTLARNSTGNRMTRALIDEHPSIKTIALALEVISIIQANQLVRNISGSNRITEKG